MEGQQGRSHQGQALAEPEQLNSATPVSEWERGMDGTPRKPWAHVVVVYLVDLATGQFYTYASPTTGGHIAYDALKEAVVVMRALRGSRVMPIINLRRLLLPPHRLP